MNAGSETQSMNAGSETQSMNAGSETQSMNAGSEFVRTLSLQFEFYIVLRALHPQTSAESL